MARAGRLFMATFAPKRTVMMEVLEGKRVAVLLSGGVDSAVAVHELASRGLRPDCFYIRIGPKEDVEWDCAGEEDIEMATSVARHYNCRLEVVDCHEEYWDRVTRYTMDKVRAGLTPNPDVMCNRLIKFGAFDEKAGKDYDLIATGHYARTEVDPHGDKWLVTSPDPVKDQTDFLAQVHGWQLRKAVFPIGHYTKDEVRRIAERERLACARRKDSQGICFLGKVDYNEYVRRYLGESPGDVVDADTGRKVGTHRGLWFHTIGQRHGLGLGGGPWFAVRKDMGSNTLYVSRGYSPAAAYRRDFPVRDFHFLTRDPWEVGGAVGVNIKVRHAPEFHRAFLERLGGGSFMVHAESPIHGVAPGQFCVVYDGDCHRCIGSAEISC